MQIGMILRKYHSTFLCIEFQNIFITYSTECYFLQENTKAETKWNIVFSKLSNKSVDISNRSKFAFLSTVPPGEAFTSLARVTCWMRSHDNQERLTVNGSAKVPSSFFESKTDGVNLQKNSFSLPAVWHVVGTKNWY